MIFGRRFCGAIVAVNMGDCGCEKCFDVWGLVRFELDMDLAWRAILFGDPEVSFAALAVADGFVSNRI